MVAPEVAREQHRATAGLDGHARGAQDVAARVAGDRRHRLGTRKDTTGRIAEVDEPPAVTTDDNGRRWRHPGSSIEVAMIEVRLARALPGLRRLARAAGVYGERVPDPDGILDVPPGFSYRVVD